MIVVACVGIGLSLLATAYTVLLLKFGCDLYGWSDDNCYTEGSVLTASVFLIPAVIIGAGWRLIPLRSAQRVFGYILFWIGVLLIAWVYAYVLLELIAGALS